MTAILDFYRGVGTDAQGRILEDVAAFTDLQMEGGHEHIQWMFPLPEPSRAQPQSPVMTEEDLEAFRTDTCLQDTALRCLRVYLRFLVRTQAWRGQRDHNHLRISRILRFLTLIEKQDNARRFYNYVTPETQAGADTRWYWREAMKPEPAYLHGGFPPLSPG